MRDLPRQNDPLGQRAWWGPPHPGPLPREREVRAWRCSVQCPTLAHSRLVEQRLQAFGMVGHEIGGQVMHSDVLKKEGARQGLEILAQAIVEVHDGQGIDAIVAKVLVDIDAVGGDFDHLAMAAFR